MTADQLARIAVLHCITPADLAALQRLTRAAAVVSSHAATGTLFEGYDGAEPQRTQACAALDELEAATHAALGTVRAIACRQVGVDLDKATTQELRP